MTLNNYYKWLVEIVKEFTNESYRVASFKFTNGTVPSTGSASGLSVCDTQANQNNIGGYCPLGYNRTFANLSVMLGSGTTEPDATDYTLASGISTSDLSVSVQKTFSADENGAHILLTISGQNNTGSDIDITEIGITMPICIASPTVGTRTLLLAREVLDTPITVAAGSAYSFVYDWTIS